MVNAKKCNGDGVHLAPHPPIVEGDGLLLKCGNDISDGAGLLMGRNSRLKIFLFWDGYCNCILEYMYLEYTCIKHKCSSSVWYSQWNSMVNIFGGIICEEGQFLGNIQVMRKVIATSGKHVDYFNEIQASHKLGYPAYRIAPEGSPPFCIFV